VTNDNTHFINKCYNENYQIDISVKAGGNRQSNHINLIEKPLIGSKFLIYYMEV
jgi:hypothetical protein